MAVKSEPPKETKAPRGSADGAGRNGGSDKPKRKKLQRMNDAGEQPLAKKPKAKSRAKTENQRKTASRGG